MINNNNHLKIIRKIEKIRSKNNRHWMNLLRLAFKFAPKEAAKIMSNITKLDKEISLLTKKLS